MFGYKKEYGDSYFRNLYLLTAKHELGHTLGLQHEHQRPDRDTYVVINGGDEANYGKIPKNRVCAGVKVIKVWFIRIYVPYIWYKQIAYQAGSFDLDSIMLYGGKPIKAPYANSKYVFFSTIQNCFVTKLNYEISKSDVESIKKNVHVMKRAYVLLLGFFLY